MRHKLHLVYISVLFAMPLIQSCDHSTSKAEKALTSVMMFHNLMKVSPVYKADIQKLKNSNGSFIGIPSFRSVKIFLDKAQRPAAILDAIRFKDVTIEAGLDVVTDARLQTWQTCCQSCGPMAWL